MDVRNILKIHLSSFGIFSYPRADRRVEVPRRLIKLVGWKDGYVYIGTIPGKLYISGVNNFHDAITPLGKIKIFKNRIIIHNSFLRKCGFLNKVLVFKTNGGMISAELDNHDEQSNKEIDKFIYGLSEDQQKDFCNIILQNFDKQEDKIKLNLFLINKLGRSPIVFRCINKPIKFHGCWSEEKNEILVVPTLSQIPNDSTDLYLLPGIKKQKGGYLVGYLLLDQGQYNDIAHAISSGDISIDSDMILCTSNRINSRLGIYNNPKDSDTDNIIKNIKGSLLNYNDFICNTFRKYDGKERIGHMPLMVRENLYGLGEKI